MAEDLTHLLSETALAGAILVIFLLVFYLYRISLKWGYALDAQAATTDVLRVISRSAIDLDAVLQTLVETAARLCNADAVGIVRPNDLGANHVAHIGLPTSYRQHLAQVEFIPGQDTLVGRALQEGKPIRIANAAMESSRWRAPERQCFRSWLCVPLLRDSSVIGIIVLARTSTRTTSLRNRAGSVTGHVIWARDVPFNLREIEVVTIFADQAFIAIENARQFDEIQHQRRQLELVSSDKSRFLAAASHDLRQPLHALNLFIAQLRSETSPPERDRLVELINAATNSMNDLFDSLLDMSKLDAGVLVPNVSRFPVQRLLTRLETTFAATGREKGLRFSVVSSQSWIRSDFILLERIMINLLSNAVRYTSRGGIVVGCRRRGNRLRLDVYDSGPGIEEDQQDLVFGEFYQQAPVHAHRPTSFGLGLSIVDRLGRLLDHPVELYSRSGKGSRFSILVPLASPKSDTRHSSNVSELGLTNWVAEKLIVVIDDDALALEGMRGILESWGSLVITAETEVDALKCIADWQRQPDLIISDYRLADGRTGIEAIQLIHDSFDVAIPAFIISGDTVPERLREVNACGYHLLNKPVTPMALRTMLNRMLSNTASER